MHTQRFHVIVRLEVAEDGYPPYAEERLWARLRGDDLVIESIPFFARGLSLGDTVAAIRVAPAIYEFDRLLAQGGHDTVRLLVAATDDVPAVRRDLRALGCPSELGPMSRLIAIDVPPGVDLDAVRAFLARGQSTGHFEVEEANVSW